MNRLVRKQYVRYLIVGGSAYIVEAASLLLLLNVLSLGAVTSVAISFWIGFIMAFLLQKYITFANKQKSKKAMLNQLVLYGLLVLLNYIFTILFVYTLAGAFGALLTRTIAIIITTIWNYFIYSKLIFKLEVTKS